MIFVILNETIYRQQVQLGLSNLISRLMLRKGSQPLKMEQLQSYLLSYWNPIGHWQITLMARGYYVIQFSLEDDMRRIWASSTCNLTSGVFRLFQMNQRFKPTLRYGFVSMVCIRNTCIHIFYLKLPKVLELIFIWTRPQEITLTNIMLEFLLI